MKNKRRVLCLLVLMSLFISLFGAVTVSADTKTKDTISTINAGKLIDLKASVYNAKGTTRYLYKFVVSQDSIVDFSFSQGKKEDRTLYILNAKKEEVRYLYTNKVKSGKLSIGLSKGTYYIYRDSNSSKLSVKMAITKGELKENYSIATATPLARNKVVSVAMPYDSENNYSRWYKITVGTKKTVTITGLGSAYVNVYDSNGDRVQTNYDEKENECYTENELDPGIYYICLADMEYEYYYYNVANFYRIKWL